MYVCTYIRVCVYAYMYARMFVCTSYVRMDVCMCVCMHVSYQCMYLSAVRLSVHPFLSLSSSFHVCLFVYLSIQPSVYLSVTVSFCLFLCPVQTSAVPTVRCFCPLSRIGPLRCLYCCLLCIKTFF